MIDLSEPESGTSLQDAMTPMIDVIFVLIAFMMLMINVPLMTMEVDLPKAMEKVQTAAVKKQVVSIAVQPNSEQWIVNNETVDSLEQLKSYLQTEKQQHGDQLSIVIHSDKQVVMERVVKLFATLQALELNVTHLALKD
ncbi:ExbD/TolR family protein [Vibrio hippocampi]|uniref:Tol-Pal system protein TolR n=1 Tax=Vibrio hippocampi TaxID=654686 RepID=A0ABN8DMV6_9VIBR|nr:biopolymer transporter ExbD [Vibrio hippocampi]CAH0528914.1 Tol-Pal system protein TolR [Vibrio hippocampi]